MALFHKLVSVSGEQLIGFYSGWCSLSLFHIAPFTVDDRTYRSVQQYYEAMKAKKFEDWMSFHEILSTWSPKKARELGNDINGYNGEEWLKVCEDVVLTGLRAKFDQNVEMKEQLMITGNAKLVYTTDFDDYWGCGLYVSHPNVVNESKWTGSNKLGKLLEKLRAEYTNVEKKADKEKKEPKVEKAEKAEKTEKMEKAEKIEKAEKVEKTEKKSKK